MIEQSTYIHIVIYCKRCSVIASIIYLIGHQKTHIGGSVVCHHASAFFERFDGTSDLAYDHLYFWFLKMIVVVPDADLKSLDSLESLLFLLLISVGGQCCRTRFHSAPVLIQKQLILSPFLFSFVIPVLSVMHLVPSHHCMMHGCVLRSLRYYAFGSFLLLFTSRLSIYYLPFLNWTQWFCVLIVMLFLPFWYFETFPRVMRMLCVG